MSQPPPQPEAEALSSVLRARARDRIAARSLKPTDGADPRALVEELLTHQVELELQGEELREVQRRLDETVRHYRELFERVPVAQLLLDDKRRIIEANERAQRIFGVDVLELYQRPLVAFVAADDADRVHVARHEGGVHGLKVMLLCRDGSSRSVVIQSCASNQGGEHLALIEWEALAEVFSPERVTQPALRGARVSAPAQSPADDAPVGALKVVLVEPDATTRREIEQHLVRLGHRPQVTEHIFAAAQLVEQRRVDVLITRVMAPGTPSSEVARSLVLRHPQLRTIQLADRPRRALLAHGIIDIDANVLEPPFTRSALANALAQLEDSAEGPTSSRGRTVLLLTHSVDLGELIRVYLDRRGYTVLSSQSPSSAAELLKQAYADLLIMDLDMVENVEAFITELRSDHPHLGALVLTEGADAPNVDGVRLLKKPFELRTLDREVKTALGRRAD